MSTISRDSKGRVDRDVLSVVVDKACAVFVGRLPRKYDQNHVLQLCDSVGAVRNFYASGDTYAFVEFKTGQSAKAAAELLNGTLVSSKEDKAQSSKATFIEAMRLTRLFIGGFNRSLDPSHIESAIRKIEPVSLQS